MQLHLSLALALHPALPSEPHLVSHLLCAFLTFPGMTVTPLY